MPAQRRFLPVIGQNLGHYRIIEKIGAGGMGEVYRAHDERLDRDVALKLLPAGILADDLARKRFRKEALALSKLNHPNIATIYDFDRHGEVDFIAMEYVDGQTLAQRIAVSALPEKEVIWLGGQIAEALEEAHEHEIVHRDLKPGNIMVTPKRRAKILDFGLATLLRSKGDEAATESLVETGAVTGTLPYMAPEQLRGEPADARSDIYATGALLYEMATGTRPFPQKLPTALVGDILHKLPSPPRRLQPELSSPLEAIILKCLEKDPESRYQSAKELLVDLRRLANSPGVAAGQPVSAHRFAWPTVALAGGMVGSILLAVAVGFNVSKKWKQRAGGSNPAKVESLAVLPLQNFSRDSEQDYFADGMTEALITNLSKVSALRVISRTSVMHYKGSNETLPQIARELNVDAVVEGSVERSGDHVRITAQLIQAAADRHLWAESYERDLRDILAVQEEVARDIAQQIQVKLTPQEKRHLAGARSVDPEAYQFYLKGRYLFYARSTVGLNNSRVYLEQAIAKDPSFAAAYAQLAEVYTFEAIFDFGLAQPAREAWAKAEAAAQSALENDETLAEAHSAMGQIRMTRDWDLASSEREFKRALELDPNSVDAHVGYAYYLRFAGRLDQAVMERKRALELDPLRLDLSNELALEYTFGRRYDEAIGQWLKSLELEPTSADAACGLPDAYERKGRDREASVAEVRCLNLSGEKGLAAPFERLYEVNGYQAARRFLDQRELENLRRQQHQDSWDLACAWARLGEKDEAFKWLERGYEERSPGLLQIRGDPDLDNLRADPRYQDLVRRMGFPQ